MKEKTSNDVYQCIKKSSTSRLFIELRISMLHCTVEFLLLKKKEKKRKEKWIDQKL